MTFAFSKYLRAIFSPVTSVALLVFTTGVILTSDSAIARDDPNPLVTTNTLMLNTPEECQTELAQQLALISIHSNNQLLEDNLDLANFCGQEMVKQYQQITQTENQSLLNTIIDGIGPIDGQINFESPHVHPIDLTPDGSRLLAVNTAAHRLEVFQISGTNLNLVASIPVGIDPVSVRARNNSEAWVVNHISDSVSVVNLNQQTVTHTLKTDNEPADVVFAGSPQRAFVSASEANRINVFNLSNLDAAPTDIVIDGEEPRALAVSLDGQRVFAAIFESGNNTGIIANSGFSGGGTIVRGVGLDDNDVAIIDAGDLGVTYRRSLMNINMALAVHPGTGNVHVVGTEALNEIETEPALNGLFLRVNTASFSGPGSSGATILDLNPHLTYQSPSVSSSLRQQSIGDPRGIAWRNNGQRAFVTGMGSNNVAVISASGARVSHFDVGQGPTGIVLNDSSGLGYVMNKFDGSISVIDLSGFSEIRQVQFDDPTAAVVKSGRPFLYDTHLTSGTGHLSCASCHVDARTDRLGWQLSNASAGSVVVPRASNSLPGAVIGSVTLDGNKDVMTTQTLIDIMDHPRFHWRGDRETIDDFNGTFVNLMGRSSTLTQAEMDAFKDFLRTTWLPPNPYRTIDNQRPQTVTLPDGSTATSTLIGPNTTDALRGGANGNNCLICHSGQGNATRNFGANDEIGEFVVAPALPALYDKMGFTFGRSGFGFFHNGAADLFEASRTRQFLAEILSLEGPEGPLVGEELRQAPHAGMGQQVTINGSISSAENNLLNQLISIANNSEWVELIAHARLNNLQRGFKLTSGNNFDADITGETTTRSELVNTAVNQPVTFTLVAAGMGTRFALDFDLDGELNNDQPPNTAPSVSIQSPSDGDTFAESESVSLTASANDAEDGNLTSAVVWESNRDGILGTGNVSTTLSIGSHIITASVQDSGGLSDSASISVVVEDPSLCGAPTFNAADDRALIVWQGCDGAINVVGAGGNAVASYTGQINSNQPLTDLELDGVESTDTVVQSSSQKIDFDITLGSIWTDAFSYRTSAGGSSCLSLTDQSAGTVILAGENRTVVTSPFDPVTLQSCSIGGGDECGSAGVNPSEDPGLFVWRECSGDWNLMLTGQSDLSSVTAAGTISSTGGFSDVDPVKLESSDDLNTSGSDLQFDMVSGYPWEDRFTFRVPNNDELCLNVSELTPELSVFAGPNRTLVTASAFNPSTLQSCSTGNTGECGDANINPSVDEGLFIWKSCDGVWTVMFTGRESFGGVRYAGTISASSSFSSVTPVTLESSDALDNSVTSAINFDVSTGYPWEDRFQFTVPDDASMCVTITEIGSGFGSFAGPDRTPVGLSFNPVTMGACQ